MQYSFISAALLALVSSVVAQTSGFDPITSPTRDQNIPAGSSFDIIWQPGTQTGAITITLLQGVDPPHLAAGPVIAKSISNSLGKYTWSVPTTSSFATYGFEITLDSAPSTLQYSFPFHITGGSSSSASGSASATGTPSTTTMQLSTGPSYTPVVTSTSTSSVPSSTSTVISTSSSANSTRATATLAPTSSSNVTLSTTLTKGTSTKTSATGSSTSSASPVSTNAAATQIAGSIAMVGGIILALAL